MTTIDDLIASRMGNRTDWLAVMESYRTLTLDEINQCLQYEDSYSRLPTLLEIKGMIDDELWFAALGECWEDSDNVGDYIDETTDALFSDIDREDIRRLMMTPEEKEAFKNLPDELTVYRGCYAANKWGLSWTLDIDIASKFPTLNRYRGEGDALLVKAKIEKNKVFALKLGRQEAEIIAYRPRHVSTRKLKNCQKNSKD